MVTGRFPHNHGIYNNCSQGETLQEELPAEEITYSELLNEAGYRLGHVGKWHIGRDMAGPRRGAFTTWARKASPSIDDSSACPRARRIRRTRSMPTIPNDEFSISGTEQLPVEGNLMYYFAEEGMRLLREYSDNQPFYLRVDFNGPHHPYVVPEPWASMYDPQQIPPWPNFHDTFENKPQVHLRHKFHRGVHNFTWEDWQPAVAKYFGYVSYLDSLFRQAPGIARRPWHPRRDARHLQYRPRRLYRQPRPV